MTRTKTEKLTAITPNGYCEYSTRETVDAYGSVHSTRGWWWRQTPSGVPYGPSYPGKFIGRNFAEATEYFESRF